MAAAIPPRQIRVVPAIVVALAVVSMAVWTGTVGPTGVRAAGRGFEPADHYALRSISDVRWSPDGRQLAYVERWIDSGTYRSRTAVFLTSPAGGAPRKLTPDDADDGTPRWSPRGSSIAVVSTVDGQNTILTIDPSTGARTRVATFETSNDPLAYQGAGDQFSWAPDGRAIAFLSADPGPEPPGTDPFVITRFGYKAWAGMNDNRRWHIRVATLADGSVRPLTKGDFHEHSIAWSPRGDEIAFVSNRGLDWDRVHNYDLYAVKVADGTIRTLTATPGSEYTPVWSSDAAWIAYQAGTRAVTTRESNAEDTHLWVLPAAGGAPRELAADLDRRVTAIEWAPDAATIYFRIQDRGNNTLMRIDAQGSAARAVAAESGSVGDFAIAPRERVAYAFTSPTAPVELMIDNGSGRPQTISRVHAALMAERQAVAPEAFDFASVDGTRVQAFFTPPLAREPQRRYPLILMIHGGPHGQQGPAFAHKAQVYAARGFATLMVNYRGSTGYGQKFSDGTVGDQNGNEARDVLAGLDAALARYPWLDGDRLGVEGGSYGGQLTNWLITQTPRFKAAIPSASIANLISLGYTIWAADYIKVEFGGFPWEKNIAAFMWERSPLAHVARVTTPTMFIHGELDQDVVVTEPEQMYNALRQRGVEAVFLRYPREGHGLREPRHVVDAMERSLAWYARHVTGRPTTSP